MGWVRSNIPFLAPVTNAIGDVAGAVGNVVSDVAQSPLVGVGLGLAFPGIGTAIGEAMGLTGAAAAAAGGAVLGGGTAAAAGGDPLKGALLGGAGGALFSGAPSDVTVPTSAPALPSSFDQYLTPSAPTSLADIANTGAISYPVAPQTPFQGTSMLDVANATPQVGTPEAVQQLANNAQQVQAAQAPIVPTDVAAAPAAVGQTPISNITGPLQNAPALPSSFDQYQAATGTGIPAVTQPTNVPALENLPQASYSNEGANYPTPESTQGAGGSPANVSMIGAGLPLVSTGGSMSDILSNLTPTQIATLGQGVLSGIGGLSTNSAISAGQAAQQAAAQQSLGTLKDIYGTNMAAVTPYQQAGQGALTQINQQMPYLTHQFDANDLNAQLAPNYQFMLGQGQMANQRAANVGGGALSGNTLQGLNKYTQDYAGNAYQNAFNNYNTQRSNIYNTLSNIAGLGTSANAQGIGAGQSYGQNVTNLNTGLAAAQAGANVAQAQNTSNTLSNIGNSATLATLLGQNNTISDAAAAAKDANSVIGAYF